jgi:Uma2 family endonuclease
VVAVPEIVVQRRLTLADYEALPDDADYEIVDGILFVAPSARPRHQVVANRFAHQLTTLVQSTGSGEVVPDADLIVDERNTYISPDIMYFAGDRFAHVDPDEMIRIIPDLVIEILSPGTDLYDLSTKRRLYETLGVPHYWIADAQAKTVRECVLDTSRQYVERLIAAAERFEPALFPGLRIDLQRIFA